MWKMYFVETMKRDNLADLFHIRNNNDICVKRNILWNLGFIQVIQDRIPKCNNY